MGTCPDGTGPRRGVRAAAALLLAAGAVRAAAAPEPAAPIRLMLGWTHQAQFAGCYVAQERGLFAERGLAVEFLRGGPGHDPVASLADGTADMALLWLCSTLLACDRGTNPVHAAQYVNASNLAIAAWKDRGIAAVGDLDGRRVSAWGDPFRPALRAFFKANEIEPELVPQYWSVNLFLRRGVDACSVMDYNEYHMLLLAGVDAPELTVFPLRDHGIDFPEDGLYAAPAFHAARPEAARRAADAILAGWRDAARDPEAAVDIVMRYVTADKVAANRTHMRWMLLRLLPSIFPADGKSWTPGVLAKDRYDETARWLVELGFVRSAPPYETFVRGS